jgi:hypothetical protein
MINSIISKRNRRIALTGLAIGSFIAGIRIRYIFNGSQNTDLIISIITTVIGLAIAISSLLYLNKNIDIAKEK